jgi:hypothetical protein
MLAETGGALNEAETPAAMSAEQNRPRSRRGLKRLEGPLQLCKLFPKGQGA